jgi:hypothetical protein
VTDLPPYTDLDLFDEAGYLRAHPGIVEAITLGLLPNPWSHYVRHGRKEGRMPNDVDPAFYLAAYPEIAKDFGRPPEAADAAPHYLSLGRARGYLPNARAPRPANAAALASPFGGFWTDQANALDLIQGRLELGRVKRRDVSMLRTFALDGAAEVERPLDMRQVKAAGLMVDRAFTGAFEDLLFSAYASGAEREPWRPELTSRSMAALDPHMFSPAIRDLVLDKQVTDVLSAIFEARPRLTATRAFLRQEAVPDRDVSWFAHTLPLQFIAVTFSLEDTEANGITIWRGSHRLPDLPWFGDQVSIAEAYRAGAPGLEAALAHREDIVRALVEGREPRTIGVSSASRTIRHANLIHAIRPPEPPGRQRSLTAWFCPSHVAPCYMEAGHARTHLQNGIEFSSGVYPGLDRVEQ